jgi:hypothetical protein
MYVVKIPAKQIAAAGWVPRRSNAFACIAPTTIGTDCATIAVVAAVTSPWALFLQGRCFVDMALVPTGIKLKGPFRGPQGHLAPNFPKCQLLYKGRVAFIVLKTFTPIDSLLTKSFKLQRIIL